MLSGPNGWHHLAGHLVGVDRRHPADGLLHRHHRRPVSRNEPRDLPRLHRELAVRVPAPRLLRGADGRTGTCIF